MGTPAKKRKLNYDSKQSPVAPRGLDLFFRKAGAPPVEQNGTDPKTPAEFSDEELARKLQAEWAQEDAALENAPQALQSLGVEFPADLAIRDEQKQTTILPDNKTEAGEHAKETAAVLQPETLPSDTKLRSTLSLQSAGSAEDTITSNIRFDESPLTFDPSKYVAELQGHWAGEGSNASYALLTRCFVLVSGTQSRIKIVDTLVNLLRILIEGDPSSLLPAVRTKHSSCLFRSSDSLVSSFFPITLPVV